VLISSEEKSPSQLFANLKRKFKVISCTRFDDNAMGKIFIESTIPHIYLYEMKVEIAKITE